MLYWKYNLNWCFPVPLWVKIPQMNGYGKHLIDDKWMNLLVHDKKCLKKTMKYGIILIVY